MSAVPREPPPPRRLFSGRGITALTSPPVPAALAPARVLRAVRAAAGDGHADTDGAVAGGTAGQRRRCTCTRAAGKLRIGERYWTAPACKATSSFLTWARPRRGADRGGQALPTGRPSARPVDRDQSAQRPEVTLRTPRRPGSPTGWKCTTGRHYRSCRSPTARFRRRDERPGDPQHPADTQNPGGANPLGGGRGHAGASPRVATAHRLSLAHGQKYAAHLSATATFRGLGPGYSWYGGPFLASLLMRQGA